MASRCLQLDYRIIYVREILREISSLFHIKIIRGDVKFSGYFVEQNNLLGAAFAYINMARRCLRK